MTISINRMALSLIVAGTLSCVSIIARAGGPGGTDGQPARSPHRRPLRAFAASAAAATGLGLRVFGGTQTTAVTGIGSPGNDGPFGGSTAQAAAYAFGGGMNGVSPARERPMRSLLPRPPATSVCKYRLELYRLRHRDRSPRERLFFDWTFCSRAAVGANPTALQGCKGNATPSARISLFDECCSLRDRMLAFTEGCRRARGRPELS